MKSDTDSALCMKDRGNTFAIEQSCKCTEEGCLLPYKHTDIHTHTYCLEFVCGRASEVSTDSQLLQCACTKPFKRRNEKKQTTKDLDVRTVSRLQIVAHSGRH